MLDMFDDLDPEFPPEEEHDYDKAVSEVQATLLDSQERWYARHVKGFYSA